MMSVSAVGLCASIVSLEPPPVAPTRRIPPARSFAFPGPPGAGLPPPPPPPPPSFPPPHAPSTPPVASTAPPLSAPRSTCRLVTGSSSQPSLESLVTRAPPHCRPEPSSPVIYVTDSYQVPRHAGRILVFRRRFQLARK